MSMMKRVGALAGTCFLALGVSFPSAAEEAQLRAAFYTSGTESPFLRVFNAFVEHVNENGEGVIQITDVVGPESIPQNQQSRALADGLVDIYGAPPSYLENLLPGLGGLSAARISTAEMRETGVFDDVNEMLANTANARMIGLFAGDIPFYLFTNREVSGLDDFGRLRLRATNTVRAFFDALGAQPMQIGRGEIYTALERGVANGYSNIHSELYSASWIEVVDYRVGPGFYAPNIGIFINRASYDALSDEAKAVLEEAGRYSEGEPSLEMQAEEDAALERAVSEGQLEVIEFSEEDSERFLDMAYESQWAEIEAQAPDFTERLRAKLLGE